MPEVRLPQSVPSGLLEKVSQWHGRYSSGDSVLQIAEIELGLYVGVFGDYRNGGYEWFVFRENESNPLASKFVASDSGYGTVCFAMRDGILKAMGLLATERGRVIKAALEEWNGEVPADGR